MTSSTPGSLPSRFASLLGGGVQLRLVGRLHGELVQALGHLAADPDGRRILQVDAHAREIGELGPQFLDDVVDQQLALGARLQVHHQLRRSSGRPALDADVPPTVDISASTFGSGANTVGDLLLILHHLVVRSALRGFGDHA